jgi:hypothetical protein
MNHERLVANSILSRLKDGEQFSRSTVDQALRDTGDLAPVGSEVLDNEIPQNSDGGGEVGSLRLVAENLIRLGEKAWEEKYRRLTKAHE